MHYSRIILFEIALLDPWGESIETKAMALDKGRFQMKYVFDIDGTLSFDGETIDPVIISAIKELSSIEENEVIFASARPIRDLLPMIPRFEQNRLIGANGAMISVLEKIDIIAKIESNYFEYLKSLINQYELDYVVDSDWNYSSRITAPSLIEKMVDPNNLAEQVDIESIKQPIKTILVNLGNNLQSRLMKSISEETNLAVIGLAGEGTVDIAAQGINKLSALRALNIEEYVAFGNDRNDLEMLSQAKQSVWVSSKPSLNSFGEQADFVVKPEPKLIAEMIMSLKE